MSGGKAIQIQTAESVIPPHLHAEARLGHPGSLLGDADTRTLISIIAQLAHKVPSVEYLRIIFKQYDEVMYLLLIPLLLNVTAEEARQMMQRDPNIYKLRIQKGSPSVSGLRELFANGGVPLREDQWYFCRAKAIKDDQEGYAVALNWTDARIEVRDILKERRQRAEAAKRRREQKKQLDGGADGVAAGKEE